jgi:pilus assembly protein CpaC
VIDTAGKAAEFAIVDGNSAFFGFLDWVQQNNIAKILAEPNIVAVSGRPAQFNVGGEIPIVVPQSLGTSSIEFKKFGTQVDFLPIVLGNGNIRLEVRPRISEIDDSRSVIVQNFVIPALTVREVDTAVEMKAGQTFALAGLVQERTESISRGLPYVSDMPIIGLPFRKVEDEVNEIELLILVTPEFVDAIEPHEVPCGGPGYATTSPCNNDLYIAGHLEVPAHCNPISGMTACGYDCGSNGYAGDCDCGPGGSVITDGAFMPGGTGYDDSYSPAPIDADGMNGDAAEPDVLRLPPMESDDETLPLGPSARRAPPAGDRRQAARPGSGPQYTVPRPYNPPRVPVYVRNASRSDNRNAPSDEAAETSQVDGLFGPVGYDPQ